KTGTAQKLINGKYSSKFYNSSFIGFFPAEDPEIVCFVLVDSPEVGRYGGQVAAPIFSNITRKILETDFNIKRNKNKIDRDGILQKFVANVEDENEADEYSSFADISDVKEVEHTKINSRTTMPNLKNKSIREAISVLSDLRIKYKIEGSGKIVSQSIEQGSPIVEGKVCILECSNNSSGIQN
ncbi:MAG: penicillin-binding transpeptidase domain-containing protein, partial [Melioribacteraceae bacterium]|nr:penicillin-binding transpeptidase domain-containing protein [Melioribacteraceae bacterium]